MTTASETTTSVGSSRAVQTVQTLAVTAAVITKYTQSTTEPVEDALRTMLTWCGACDEGLDLWARVRGSDAPYYSLASRLLVAAEGVWSPQMSLTDAIAWALVADQWPTDDHLPTVTHRADEPGRWAFAAAGISRNEATTGAFTSEQVRTMAALRGITLPSVLPLPLPDGGAR